MAQRLTDEELRALLDIYMCADPLPATDAALPITRLLTLEAAERGYASWVEAYHYYMVPCAVPAPAAVAAT